VIHIHPPDRTPLRAASLGEVHPAYVVVAAKLLEGKSHLEIEVT
jgi:hypothetical protein